MLDANNQPISVGDTIRLISKPDGSISQHYPLTVGGEYKVQDFYGSNVVTTCDEQGCTVDYWRGRVVKVSAECFAH
jgi:hypothetical protein